jgi:5-aminopentanamidase
MKLALWQTTGFPADAPSNIGALERAAHAAALADAALLLCPECWLCGYNIGAAVTDLAELRDGPSARQIAAIAQRNHIAIAYGYAERDMKGERIYNAVQVIGPAGELLSEYRKAHLFGPYERAVYQPGDRLERPFVYGGLTIGLLICYDVEYPEAVRSLALMGAELVLVPTALPLEYASVPDFIVPARSVENQIFVAYCNRTGVENGMQFLGRSCLTGPDGKPVVSAGGGEALIIADVSREAIHAAAGSYPYLRDRRPELYGLLTSSSGCAPPVVVGSTVWTPRPSR